MDDASVRWVLSVVRAVEHHCYLAPADWPDLAVGMLLEGAEDPEIAELAALSRQATGWDTAPLVTAVYERHGVTAPGADEATDLVARLMADDLRARPASVTSPMIRLLARLGAGKFDSDLANRCYYAEEYLDCDCCRDDPGLEAELQRLPTLGLPAAITQALARLLRSTLPTVQPPLGH